MSDLCLDSTFLTLSLLFSCPAWKSARGWHYTRAEYYGLGPVLRERHRGEITTKRRTTAMGGVIDIELKGQC